MLLGCIADDVTGATDLGDTLVRAGLRTTLLLGVPGADSGPSSAGAGAPAAGDDGAGPADAVVVALKTRTVPAADAVAQSLAAARWLRGAGAAQTYFKYCSTFDSTDDGNIGPVTEALLDLAGATFTVHCPAYPATGRTVYAGHLFVGDVLLSESSMRDHPLTPMTDADLVRVLGRQSTRPVGLVALRDVRLGVPAVLARFAQLQHAGVAHAVIDATSVEDLLVAGRAAVGLGLAAGASGLADALARALVSGRSPAGGPLDRPPPGAAVPSAGAAVVFSGSCSAATRSQVDRFAPEPNSFAPDATSFAPGADSFAPDPDRVRRFDIDPLRLPDAIEDLVGPLRAAVREGGPVLVTSTAAPADVARVQQALGREEAGRRVEAAMARLAREAVDAGARRLIVAGGETAGAVTSALGLRALEIGPTIAPGVPWTAALDEQGRALAIACKSGNFGGPSFFADALAVNERHPVNEPRP